MSVAPCRSPADPLLPDPPPACLPRRLPAHVRPPRSLIKDEHALQRKGKSQTLSLSDSLSGDHGIYTSACISAAPSIIVLRALRVYKSGSPPEGLFPPGPAHSRRSSYTGVSGVQNGVRISWRHGVPTGAQGRDLPGRLACVSRNHLRACSSAVGPMQWPRCVACLAQ